MMKRLLPLGLLSLLCSCGAETTKDPGENGGNTNWLKPCNADADCDDEDACVSNVCLKPCSDSDVCEPLAGASCTSLRPVSTDESGDCSSGAAASYCSLTCDGDADCSRLGDTYGCDDGVCAPSCTPSPAPEPTTAEPEPTTAEPEPTTAEPEPVNAGECVVAMDVAECCPQAFATRRSELEASECWYEVVDGDYSQPSGLPQTCFPSCVDLPCPPRELPGPFGVAVEGASGSCVLEAACDDGSCPGSACDPVIGCDRGFTDPVTGGGPLECQASACGEPGLCVLPETSACDDIFAPVCGCDGVTYDNRCQVGYLAPILHEGGCDEPTPEPSPEPTQEPSPEPVEDECVVTINGAECCPLPEPMRRSELEADPCRFEFVNGDLSPWNEIPGECLQLCPAIACSPLDPVSEFGVAQEVEGSCTIVPACEDGSCASSPCDPQVGCSVDWSCTTPNCSPDSRLACVADSCDGPGVCTIHDSPVCPPELAPLCGCDGTTYTSSCDAGPNAIAYEGECVADGSAQ